MDLTKAKKHFEDALGGNMNIGTLKPIVFIEIMEEYHQSQLKLLGIPSASVRVCDNCKHKCVNKDAEYR